MRQALIGILSLALLTTGATAQAQDTTKPHRDQETQKVDTNLPMGPILLGSFGAVAVVVGAGFAWQAKGEYDNFNKRDPKATHVKEKLYPKATQSLADEIKTHVIVADVLMFGGAIAMGAALIWALRGRQKEDVKIEPEASTASFKPTFGPNHLGMLVEF